MSILLLAEDDVTPAERFTAPCLSPKGIRLSM